MRKLFLGLLFIVAFITFLPFKGYVADDVEEELRLYIGQSKVVSVSSPKRVAVGNPAIADVANIGKNELTVIPKAVGNTTLIIWDNFGEQAYRLMVFAEDTAELKRRIDNMLKKLNLPDIHTNAEDEEGKVVLLGIVKRAADRERIATALGPLKDKTIDLIIVKEEETVIEIDVQVIELNRGSQDTLGFTWPSSLNLTEVGSPGISEAGTTWGKLFHVVNITRDAFTLKLDALIKDGKARILSRPRVSCQSGKEAKLVVGGEVPVLSGSVTPGTSGSSSVGATTGGSVEYKEYGIILNVRPALEESGRIHLNLDVTVSEVGDVVSTTYALAYKMTKRTATTELFLDDGQTMALGGLIKKKSTEELNRVPWLSDVPVLGMFFRQRTISQGWSSDLAKADDTELFITLTPRVIDQKKLGQEIKPSISGAPAISDDDIKDPVVRYARIIQRKILENLTYPAAAKEAGFQGSLKLSLKLSAQGDLLDSKIKEPSSYRLLDENAIKVAKKISPYPPFPPAIKEAQLWVDVPIIYQLE
jgi:pilus assembly protein CpaC